MEADALNPPTALTGCSKHDVLLIEYVQLISHTKIRYSPKFTMKGCVPSIPVIVASNSGIAASKVKGCDGVKVIGSTINTLFGLTATTLLTILVFSSALTLKVRFW